MPDLDYAIREDPLQGGSIMGRCTVLEIISWVKIVMVHRDDIAVHRGTSWYRRGTTVHRGPSKPVRTFPE